MTHTEHFAVDFVILKKFISYFSWESVLITRPWNDTKRTAIEIDFQYKLTL